MRVDVIASSFGPTSVSHPVGIGVLAGQLGMSSMVTGVKLVSPF